MPGDPQDARFLAPGFPANAVTARSVDLREWAVPPRLHHELEGGYVAQVAAVLRRRPDVRVERPEVAAQVTIVVADAVTRWLAHSAPRSLDRALYVDEVVRLLGAYLGRDR